MKPRIPIWSPQFRYVPASHTDVAKIFERERERLKRERARETVVPIKKAMP